MSLSGSAKLAGVIGWPVAQSLSPALHSHWLGDYGIDGAYLPLAVRPEDFAPAVDGLARAGFVGFNVTVPHKEAAFALAARHDEAAKVIGAVNLLVWREGLLEGRNTDAYGLTAALGEAAVSLQGKVAAIWGAGGTTRAAIYALAGMGVAEIRLFNRTPAKAVGLVQEFSKLMTTKLYGGGYEEWAGRSSDVAAVIHTTSAGMKNTPSLDLPLDGLPADAVVFDAVYNPLETGLLARARTRGLRTVDGLWMLLHQAVPSFEAFFDVKPVVTAALRTKLIEALRGG